MKKLIKILLVFSTLLQGCAKDNVSKDYPTTLKKKSANVISQMRTNYFNRNQYVTSSLNDYGFCELGSDSLSVGNPPYIGAITKSEATDIVKTFVSENMGETGVENPDELYFSQASIDTGYGGALIWALRSVNQKIDTIEVINTKILFQVINGKVTLCYGNWYPQIYIPKKFTVSTAQAKALLNGRVVSHYTFAGDQYSVTISKSDLDKSSVHLKIVPEESKDEIKLHVCWQINIPAPVSYMIYVDVMTGAVIGQESTVIS